MKHIRMSEPIEMQVDAYVGGRQLALCDISDFIDNLVEALVSAWEKLDEADDG